MTVRETRGIQVDCRRRATRASARAQGLLEALGAVPQRARVGHGARGLQPERRRVGILSARSRAVARIPLERRWSRGNLRSSSDDLLRAGAVEWTRSDLERACVWSYR